MSSLKPYLTPRNVIIAVAAVVLIIALVMAAGS